MNFTHLISSQGGGEGGYETSACGLSKKSRNSKLRHNLKNVWEVSRNLKKTRIKVEKFDIKLWRLPPFLRALRNVLARVVYNCLIRALADKRAILWWFLIKETTVKTRTPEISPLRYPWQIKAFGEALIRSRLLLGIVILILGKAQIGHTHCLDRISSIVRRWIFCLEIIVIVMDVSCRIPHVNK